MLFRSASLDCRYTSGTLGYGGALRQANNSSPSASATSDAAGVRVSVNAGSVPYDVLKCQIISDASYPI